MSMVDEEEVLVGPRKQFLMVSVILVSELIRREKLAALACFTLSQRQNVTGASTLAIS